MESVDSHFLVWYAGEILAEMKNLGWFERIKSSLVGYSDC